MKMKAIFKGSIFAAIAYIILGLVLVIWPDITIKTLVYVTAAVLGVGGIVSIVRYIIHSPIKGEINSYLASGLVMLMVALFMYLREDLVVTIIPFVLGLAIVIDGFVKLQRSIDLARLHFEGWVLVLLMAAISIALGVVLLTRPIDTARVLTIVLGIGLIFSGVTGIVVNIFINSKLKNLAKDEAITVESVANDEEDLGKVKVDDSTITVEPVGGPAPQNSGASVTGAPHDAAQDAAAGQSDNDGGIKEEKL